MPAWMNPPYTPTMKKPSTTSQWLGGFTSLAAAGVWRLSSDQTVTATIAIDRMRRNARSGMSSAAHTPTAAPIIVGMLAFSDHGQSIAPCWWKPTVPTKFCARMPTRLVPLASGDGSPMNNRMGRIRNEPPPATTFSAPATTPAATSSINSTGRLTFHRSYNGPNKSFTTSCRRGTCGADRVEFAPRDRSSPRRQCMSLTRRRLFQQLVARFERALAKPAAAA